MNNLNYSLALAKEAADNIVHELIDALEVIDTAEQPSEKLLDLRGDIASHLRHAMSVRDGVRESIDRLENIE